MTTNLKEARAKLRHTITVIETSDWVETKWRWGERAEWGDDDRRDEVLRDLKVAYRLIGGPRL